MDKPLKKLRKFISVLVVFLLLTTVISSVVSSRGFFLDSTDSKERDNTDRPIIDLLQGKSIKEIILQLREKLRNLRERLSQIINQRSTQPQNNERPLKFRASSLLESIRTYVSFRSQSQSGFMLYTNYNGIETSTKLRFVILGLPVKVDVDGDGDKDIQVSFRIYPGIKAPFALTANIRLKIERLSGFDNINELFEAYVEFYFPGLLIKQNQGDRLRFGYHSPKGEEVPNTCVVTYEYTPYLLYAEKPSHSVKINAGSAADKSNLAIVYSFANAAGDGYSSEDIWKVEFSPAVDASISLTGVEEGMGRKFSLKSSKESLVTIYHTKTVGMNTSHVGLIIDKVSDFTFELSLTPFSKGGGNIEYQRISANPVNITLFIEKDKTTYIYVDELPKHIQFHWKPELNGYIELNAFGDRIPRAGIRNAVDDEEATAKAWFENLPSISKVQWNWSFLEEAKLEIYTDAEGCSAHVYTKNFLRTDISLIADFYTNENFDFSVYWSFTDNYFMINRSNVDLEFSVAMFNKSNEILLLQGEIKRIIDNPFEIILGELFDGNATIIFSGIEFEISNFTAMINLGSVGRFFLEMTKFKKSKYGNITTTFTAKKQAENVYTFNFTLDVKNGIYIEGLTIGFKDFRHQFGDIDTQGDYYLTFEITLTVALIDIWISEDRSEGYICISGGLKVTFDTYYENLTGEIVCLLKGTIEFDTEGSKFNLSWRKLKDGKTQYLINGTACLSLSGFKLWVKDKINVSIPYFAGKFEMDTRDDKSGKLTLILDDASARFNWDTNFTIQNLFGFTFFSNVDVNLDMGLSGYIEITWDMSGITSIKGNSEGSFEGTLDISELVLKYETETDVVSLTIDRIHFSGNLTFEADLTNKSFEVSINEGGSYTPGSGSGFSVANFQFIKGKDDAYPGDVESADQFILMVDQLDFSAGGFIKFNKNESKDRGGSIGSGTFELEVDGNGFVSLNNFYLNDPSNSVNIRWSFSTYLDLAGVVKLYVAYVDGPGTHPDDPDPKIIQVPYKFQLSLNEGSISINNFYFSINNGELEASWDLIQLRASFELNVEKSLDGKEIEIGASGTGSVRIQLFRLTTTITKIKTVQFGLINIELDDFSGSAIILNVNSTGSNKNLTFESITLGASITQVALTNLFIDMEEIPDLVNIGSLRMNFSSQGSFSLLYNNGNFSFEGALSGFGDVSLEGLYLNITNITVDLSKLQMSFSAAGSLLISYENEDLYINGEILGQGEINIDIKNLLIVLEGILTVELLKFIMDISGPASFSLTFEDRILSMGGSLRDENSIVYIDDFFVRIDILDMYILLDDFEISGPTIYNFVAYAEFEEGNPLPVDFYLLASCDSTWTAKEINVAGYVKIKNLIADGQLSAGLTDGTKGIELVVTLDGNWNLGEFYVINFLTMQDLIYLGSISVNGDMVINIDNDILLLIIAIAMGGIYIPIDSIIKIIANEDSNIDWKIIPPGSGTILKIENANFDQGEYTLSWNISGNGYIIFDTPDTGEWSMDINLLNIFTITLERGDWILEWEIDFDGDGYIFLDTNNQWRTISFTIFEFMFFTGSYRANNFNISWDWDAGIFDKVKWTGTFELGNGTELWLFIEEAWHKLLPRP